MVKPHPQQFSSTAWLAGYLAATLNRCCSQSHNVELKTSLRLHTAATCRTEFTGMRLDTVAHRIRCRRICPADLLDLSAARADRDQCRLATWRQLGFVLLQALRNAPAAGLHRRAQGLEVAAAALDHALVLRVRGCNAGHGQQSDGHPAAEMSEVFHGD